MVGLLQVRGSDGKGCLWESGAKVSKEAGLDWLLLPPARVPRASVSCEGRGGSLRYSESRVLRVAGRWGKG